VIMPREIKDANISHVSYVDKAANGRKFFMTKAEGAKTSQDQLKKLFETIDFAIKQKEEAAATHKEADNEQTMISTMQSFFDSFKYLEEEFKKYNDIRTAELEAVEASIQKNDERVWSNLFKTEGYRFKK
jgi:membrane-associated HD superfamily phosphohydrolase